ncbi:FAD-binding protein [Aquimarina sediminis]|uniref:FAD-binding protein n=1 Tax=Aquimarina sediminis TaxID=2070536 RepID=UPI000CA010A7|nr:FAD-binding protein [Aquimarina sediminis]
MNHAINSTQNNFIEHNFQSLGDAGLQDFTIQTWLKTDHFGSLFQHNSTKNNSYFFIDISMDGKISFASQSKGTNSCIETIRGGINNGQWHYVSVIKKDADTRILVNGKLIATMQIDTPRLPKQNIEGVLIGKNHNQDLKESIFQGELGGIVIWDRALSNDETIKHQKEPITGNEDGILMNHPFNVEKDQGSISYKAIEKQSAIINIINDSPFELKKIRHKYNALSSQFPEFISANSTITVTLKDTTGLPEFYASAAYINHEQPEIELTIEVKKSLTPYNSYLIAPVSPILERDITVKSSTAEVFDTELRISENLVIINAKNLNHFIKEIIPEIGEEKIVTSMNYDDHTGKASSTGRQIIEYNQACQLFNRRIQKKPLAIVYCSCTDDVQIVYKAAIKYNLPISVRSGGHDHEGECSGSNTILIDLIGLNEIVVDKNTKVAEIGPGNRFIKLTTALAKKGVMIPHGTCATVAIPGFIMGGGWGPWTRSKGMCCEYLVKAEIILGDGSKEIVSEKHKPELLWALKGGGGMSYGIVTKFFIQTFDLPETLVKFELEWNQYDKLTQEMNEKTPTINVLRCWEEVIKSKKTSSLIGTNLKINGKPLLITGYKDENCSQPIYEDFHPNTVTHNCVMYGYWEGTEEKLDAFIKREFTDMGVPPDAIRIDGIGGIGTDYGANLMSSWDRESYQNIKLLTAGEEGMPLPPDLDEPAPHKITSRLVDKQGLGFSGHEALLSSLTSPLILKGNREKGLFTYVTLGAIYGDFYKKMSPKDKEKSAFPYKDKIYTIQYQTWWNNELAQKEELQDNKVYTRTNRALDWIEASRDFEIPNTSGAFISFKDSSIPTKTYFAQNYHQLKYIKEKYAMDQYNHLRKRKTII